MDIPCPRLPNKHRVKPYLGCERPSFIWSDYQKEYQNQVVRLLASPTGCARGGRQGRGSLAARQTLSSRGADRMRSLSFLPNPTGSRPDGHATKKTA